GASTSSYAASSFGSELAFWERSSSEKMSRVSWMEATWRSEPKNARRAWFRNHHTSGMRFRIEFESTGHSAADHGSLLGHTRDVAEVVGILIWGPRENPRPRIHAVGTVRHRAQITIYYRAGQSTVRRYVVV